MPAMSMAFEELEKHARALSVEEKAALARILIEELDTTIDPKLISYGLKRHNVAMRPFSEVSLKRSRAMR